MIVIIIIIIISPTTNQTLYSVIMKREHIG